MPLSPYPLPAFLFLVFACLVGLSVRFCCCLRCFLPSGRLISILLCTFLLMFDDFSEGYPNFVVNLVYFGAALGQICCVLEAVSGGTPFGFLGLFLSSTGHWSVLDRNNPKK